MPDRMTHFSTVCNYDFYFSKGHFNLLLEFVNSFALLIKVTTLRKKGFGKEVGQSKTTRTKKSSIEGFPSSIFANVYTKRLLDCKTKLSLLSP